MAAREIAAQPGECAGAQQAAGHQHGRTPCRGSPGKRPKRKQRRNIPGLSSGAPQAGAYRKRISAVSKRFVRDPAGQGKSGKTDQKAGAEAFAGVYPQEAFEDSRGKAG